MAQTKTLADQHTFLIKPYAGQTVPSIKVLDINDDTFLEVKADGSVLMENLPTSDPEVAGQLWSNSNVLTVSAGA